MTFLSVSGLCAYDNPVNSLEINLADIIEERFKRDMVVSCFDILFKSSILLFSELRVTVTPIHTFSSSEEKLICQGASSERYRRAGDCC